MANGRREGDSESSMLPGDDERSLRFEDEPILQLDAKDQMAGAIGA